MCLLSFCSFDAPVVLLFIMCSIFPIIFTFVSCSDLIFVALLACCVHKISHCVSSCSRFVIVSRLSTYYFASLSLWCGPFVSWHFLLKFMCGLVMMLIVFLLVSHCFPCNVLFVHEANRQLDKRIFGLWGQTARLPFGHAARAERRTSPKPQ